MKVLKAIPTLAFVVALYNILVFLPGDIPNTPIRKLPLPSGAEWAFLISDLILTVSIILLYIEVFKSTKTSTVSIVDHGLSTAVFIICLLEFIMVGKVGNSVFFIIMLFTLFDVVAGFTITISTARRDFGVGAHADMQ